MTHHWFEVHDGLASARRISMVRFHEHVSAVEMLLLLLCGAAAAAATGFIRLGLRIPGHAIILAVIPMALGYALTPRRLAGLVMSAGAFGTATAFSLAGLTRYGTGAIISLSVTGLVMDLALARARNGWRLYLGMILAGTGANLLALTSRGASKLLGLDFGGGMRPFADWWSQAAVTYTLSGAVAGLIGALCCFRLLNGRSKQRPSRTSAGTTGDRESNAGPESNA